MKKLLSFAFICAALIPTSAMALEDGQRLDVTIVESKSAGSLTPFLVKSDGGPMDQCLYVAVWENNKATDSVECLLREQKTIGHTSCVRNAKDSFATIVIADYCQGFDQFGRVQDIDYMILGESPSGALYGAVLFEGNPMGPFSIVAE